MKRDRFAETLQALAHARVEFIVVGMAAGVLQGVPLTTLDIDIVHRRTPENVSRLLTVLSKLKAVYRNDPRNLSPSASHLLGPGHQLLTTSNGDLDCLGAVDGDKDYDALFGVSRELFITEDTVIRVLELGMLLEVKRRAGRPKDLAVLPFLEATIDEISKKP
jgi:hypothetical protein